MEIEVLEFKVVYCALKGDTEGATHLQQNNVLVIIWLQLTITAAGDSRQKYKTFIRRSQSQTVRHFPVHGITIDMKGVYLLLVSAAAVAIFSGMDDELLRRPSDNNQFL